jgi:glycine hydroxymethyltransferase
MKKGVHYPHLKRSDPDVFRAIMGEEKREAEGLELIPSENYVSLAVREANSSVFTNKYSEGYPGKRYYGGQEFTDDIERIAIARACKLFGAKYANVQPHSGAQANMAVYAALLSPGDTVIGMDLSHGGHLTHGAPVTLPAKVYRFIRYKMKDTTTGAIDYDALREMAQREKPKIILAGFSAYPRELDYKRFVAIAREAGAVAMMDAAHIAGLIAGKATRNPLLDGFDIMTTTTHKTLRGPRSGLILVRESEEIAKKIDKAIFPGTQGGPHMHTVAAKAVCFGEALRPSFRLYAKQIMKNAKAMEKVFRARKVPMVAGGTSNHLILADVHQAFGVSGGEVQTLLDSVGITLNKNAVPDDSRPPMDPSGIRFGTPAMTTRMMKEKECAEVAGLMLDAIEGRSDPKVLAKVRTRVRALAKKFPIPEKYA